MLDFAKTQNEIKKYIETNFPKYLEENNLIPPSEWVDDVLDLDEHVKNITVFYDFDSVEFGFQSFETQEQKLTLEICFVCRNAAGSKLRQMSRDYATAFYNWFYDKQCDRNFGGLVDFATINTVNFFDAAQGTKAIKISNLTLTINLDD